MRIAYLCKRQYMNHDVIVDRYARLYEQPYQLARLGHDLLGLCPSYHPTNARDEVHEAAPGQLRWIGLEQQAGLPSRAASLLGLFSKLRETLGRFEPDIIVGASDAPLIILGSRLAEQLRVPFAADLYDHFASFGLSRLPGIVPLYKQALRSARWVSCVSEPLAALVREDYGAKGDVFCLPSTISQDIFQPQDKAQCRAALGLPASAKLIGTAGGLSAEKGIAPLFEAYSCLTERRPDVHLVLAGKLDPACPPPVGRHVHFLGQISHRDISMLFNALDLGVVYLRDTPYGRYSFPQKAYEMAACRIPMAVTRVGAMEAVFQNWPTTLYQADNAEGLLKCLVQQLDQPVIADVEIPTWEGQARVLSARFEAGLGELRGNVGRGNR